MYNLRYHIASLVGVFLSLALGLVLGGLVVQRGAVDRQQTALVEGLRKEFASLRDENRALTDSNETLESLAGELVDSWSTDRLAGKTVLLVTSQGREAADKAVADAVESAGGALVKVVILRSGLDLDDDALRALVATGPPGSDPLRSVAASLASEWTTASATRPVTEALVKADALRIDGLEGGRVVDAVVDVAVEGDGAEPGGIALAKALGATLPAIGAQGRDEGNSLAREARAAGLSALDTLGGQVGRYTLIALLSGATPGYYGDGEEALAPFPEL